MYLIGDIKSTHVTIKFNIRDNLKVTTNWSKDFKYQMGGLVTTGVTLKNSARLSEEDLR